MIMNKIENQNDIDIFMKDEVEIANLPSNEIIFDITSDGTFSFLRRYTKLDDEIKCLFKDIFENDEEFKQLCIFLDGGSKINHLFGNIPLCG